MSAGEIVVGVVVVLVLVVVVVVAVAVTAADSFNYKAVDVIAMISTSGARLFQNDDFFVL